MMSVRRTSAVSRGGMVRGLQLSRRFYQECAVPLFRKELPDLMPFLAVGLVGEGSECFGFDDEYSIDHDWGPGFCVWCQDARLSEMRKRVAPVLRMLPESFMGYQTRMSENLRHGRVGLFGIGEFYSRFINLNRPPASIEEWLSIPEHFLATCTNGEVFSDPSGGYTAFRNALLSYYPQDVRLKKMAARCAVMAQSGQYNLIRCLRRKERGAAMLAVSRFVEAAISLLFLLSLEYMPFYKWAFRACRKLLVAVPLIPSLEYLIGCPWMHDVDRVHEVERDVEAICSDIAGHLRFAGLSSKSSSWLMHHAEEMQQRIVHDGVRNLPIMSG